MEQAGEEMEDEDRTPSLRLGGDEDDSPNAGEGEGDGDEEEEGPLDPTAASVAAAATPGEADTPDGTADVNVGNGNEEMEEEEGATMAATTPPASAAATPGEEEAEVEEGTKKRGRKKKDAEAAPAAKKPKKRNTNVWSKSTTRKSGKKGSSKAQAKSMENENLVYLNPVLPKVEDAPHLPVLLSKFQKAEKVELSADQLAAGSVKGYRMVRATRGVIEGAWYFEILVEHLGKTGHTRLGWCTQKGDVQAPVGYDTHGYAYRDLEGSKVHAALRELYGEAYHEGDVIGFYINLPNGAAHAPKSPEVVSFKGLPYTTETKDEPLKLLPGSEIAFFKNGVCQGCAYKDIYAGRYYPAASMYTLPNEPNCTVRFNFGPEFWCQPSDWSGLTPPEPMSSAPFAQLDPVAAAVSGLQNEPAAPGPLTPASKQDADPAQTPASNDSTPAAAAVEIDKVVTVKKTPKGSAPKPPKPKTAQKSGGKKASKKLSQSPGLQLAVEVPIESADAIVSQADEVRRIAQEAAAQQHQHQQL